MEHSHPIAPRHFSLSWKNRTHDLFTNYNKCVKHYSSVTIVVKVVSTDSESGMEPFTTAKNGT